MDFDPRLESLLFTRELQYAAAIGVVAVLVLLLIRRQPSPASVALFLVGGLLTLLGAPLLEASLSIVDHAVANASTELVRAGFWRTLVVGGAAAVAGVVCMARAWRDSPER